MAVADWLENYKDVDGVGAENAEMFVIVDSTIYDVGKVRVRVEVKNR